MHVTEVCERIVVLEKGQIVKDIVTAPATLKELETYFSGAAEAPSTTETVATADSLPADQALEDHSAVTSDSPEK
jgi:ABC-type sugar transport system ATPase subunit